MTEPEKELPIATKAIPRMAGNVRDEDGATVGLTFTQGSDTKCRGSENFSLTTVLMCDEAITG